MAVTFSEATRNILDAKNYAMVATVGRDGAPHGTVVWVKRDGDTVLFSTTADRQKARNLGRDPRVSVVIFDLAQPYSYVEIRGTAELINDPDRSLVHELANKYTGKDYSDVDSAERMIIRVTPEKVTGFAA